jgi:ABC-2 type transport system ATP-binding protein
VLVSCRSQRRIGTAVLMEKSLANLTTRETVPSAAEPLSVPSERPISEIGLPLAVETLSLRKVFGRFVSVADLSIQVRQGEVFGFLGPNGAGKTTSIKMLMGLVRPTSGTARLLGKPLGDRGAKRQIGFLPELFRFHDWLTGEEFLELHGKLYGMSAAERRRRIPEVLGMVGLADRGHQPLRSYSKGMQQRAGLAQALLNSPRVVFLDEPTSALDPVGRRDVRDIIRRLRDEGRTVFLNSHLLSEVESVCDRVAIINHGQVAAVGPMRELLRRELTVEFRLDDWNEVIADSLRRHGSVEGVHDDAGHVVVAVTIEDDEQVARAVDALVAAGARVYGVTPHSLTLEELFFEVVARKSQSDEDTRG